MIFFNSSMPRSMSTLLQCILNQNDKIIATQTDPVLEYLYGARINYTNLPEVKSMPHELSLNTWKGFCWGALKGYVESYSNKPNICIKTRGATIHYNFFEFFMPYKPKMICMVRDLKSIFSSMEKIYRKNQHKHQDIQNHAKMTGTTTAKRIDIWASSPPIGLSLERLHQTFLETLNKNFIYIRAEDLTTNPKKEMQKIYDYLGFEYFNHDFNNVEQSIKEDDNVYGLTNDLHTIRKKIEPVENDHYEILGKQICECIDKNFYWYQKLFGYVI
jgi:sulfotransferase